MRSACMFQGFVLIVVEMKFTAPKMDDALAKWTELRKSLNPLLLSHHHFLLREDKLSIL
jgi:hypothetical protein